MMQAHSHDGAANALTERNRHSITDREGPVSRYWMDGEKDPHARGRIPGARSPNRSGRLGVGTEDDVP